MDILPPQPSAKIKRTKKATKVIEYKTMDADFKWG